MAFKGYKMGFYLHIKCEQVTKRNEEENQTYLISLYFTNNNFELNLFSEIEKIITKWLEPYQYKVLTETDLFKSTNNTIEDIAEKLFYGLKQYEQEFNINIVRLDLQDKLSRSYSISSDLLDNSVNEISVIPFDYCKEDKEIVKQNKVYENLMIKDTILDESKLEIKEIEKQKTVDDTKTNNKIKNNKFNYLLCAKIVSSLAVFFIISIWIMYCIESGGNYPKGWDTLCHIYRSDLLLQNILKGNFYPLYDPMWYNGVEIMRYWAPLPLYILAAIQYLIKSSATDAYVVFCGVIFFFGAIGWLIHGIKVKRIGLAVFLGIIWFFLPENMRLLMQEGNLPRVVINTLLPIFIFYLWDFLQNEKRASLIKIIVLTSLMGLCHIGITFMAIVCILIFVGIYTIVNKKKNLWWKVAFGMFLGICIIGIWMYPSMQGGAAGRGNSSNQVMERFFESGFVSLNPLFRFKGDMGIFYYGLSIFIISLLGTILGTKKTLPGFLTTLIIFACTTKSIFSIFVYLPFSQYLWMIRFITISLAFFIFSIFLWDEIKTKFTVIICIMLLIDCISSIPYIYVKPEYRVDGPLTAKVENAKNSLIDQAKDITKQRMAIMELSTYGAFAPYYVSGTFNKVQYTFGAGWEGAKTADNIVLLNTALNNGRYTYIFDRCIELGTDTIVFPIECLQRKEFDIPKVVEEGSKLGYELINENKQSLLFKLKLNVDTDNFGVITSYDNLAIGLDAKEITLMFPNFELGHSNNLDDYSIEELAKYKKIYLSNFIYKDKLLTEKKLTEVSNLGTKIYIDMNHIPVNKKTNIYEIFGVSAQTIIFNQGFSSIMYNNEKNKLNDFDESSDPWNTVYLSGLYNEEGYAYMDDKKLPFVGTQENRNIVFIGFNIVYHAEISGDAQAEKLVSEIMEEKNNNIPKRKIVPLKISYSNNNITIESYEDKVNTSLSYLDIFKGDKPIFENNNLLIVDKGITQIKLSYPYFTQGMILSIIGVLVTIIFICKIKIE